MKDKFRIDLNQAKSLQESVKDLKNSTLRCAAEGILGGANIPSSEPFLKAHGNVTWSKGGAF